MLGTVQAGRLKLDLDTDLENGEQLHQSKVVLEKVTQECSTRSATCKHIELCNAHTENINEVISPGFSNGLSRSRSRMKR